MLIIMRLFPKSFGYALLLASGWLPLFAGAVTPPVSLAGQLFTEYSLAHSSNQIFFRPDGSWYDIYLNVYETNPPLRVGTYSYKVNADNTATLALSFRAVDGTLSTDSSTLTFYDATSGYDGSPAFSFFLSPAPDPVNLANLSSRSLVNPTVPVTAGFVVTGTTPRLYLIRAIGPTLRSYGVTDAVSDVSLKLYQGSSLIAENDDWGMSTTNSVADLTQAFAQVGAFSLPTGSKDAVILHVLAPGVYSAQAFSAETGEVLVEVYQLP